MLHSHQQWGKAPHSRAGRDFQGIILHLCFTDCVSLLLLLIAGDLEGMGCSCVFSCSVVSDSLQPHGLQPTRLLCPWDFPGKSAGVGCHCLLWGKEISRLKKEIQTCFFLSVSCSYRFHSSNKCTWRQWLLISVTAVGSNFRIWFWFCLFFSDDQIQAY